MATNIKRIWIFSLVLGWSWDFLFWEKTPGISFAIFVLMCVLSGLFLFYSEKHKPPKKTLWLLAPIAFFSVLSFMRQEPFSLLISIGCTLLLLQILAMSISGGNWLAFGFVDYLLGWLRLWQSVIIHPIMAISQVAEPQNDTPKKVPSRQIWPIVRGIIIALPVLCIFIALLSSADAIFAQKLGGFLDLLSLEKLPEYLLRIISILLIAYALVGVYYHAIEKSIAKVLYNEDGSPISSLIGFTESVIVLGSVILLFAAFVSIQFQYFFGGQANIAIDGFTYSEYARRGFGELLAVAILTLLLLLLMSQISRRDHLTQRRTFSTLSSIMVVLVGIILISAFERLLLYESIYGFTRLRTYTHVFMIWLGVLLVVTVLLEIFQHLRFFTNATLLVALGFVLTINLLNVDGFIVQRNVQRENGKGALDISYLASLSTDAVPTLVSLFQSPNLPDQTRDALGASLACMIRIKPNIDTPTKDWQSFQLSQWWARNALLTVDDQLSGYETFFNDSELKVTTPENQTYLCDNDWWID